MITLSQKLDGKDCQHVALTEDQAVVLERAGWQRTSNDVAIAITPDVFDPAVHTVDEVNAYLDDNPDQTSTVLELEAAGKQRAGILTGPHGQPA